MSRLSLLIAVSLVANVVLGVVWWQRASANERATAVSAGRERLAVVDDPQSNAGGAASGWPAFDSVATDEDFVARLRRDGFPTRVIRDLVRLRIQDRYAARIAELSVDARPVPYWRNRLPPDEGHFERRASLRALHREITDTLKALLGSDAFALPGEPAFENRERTYGPIPPDKIAGIEAIVADYAEMSNQVREATKGILFPEDREMLVFLEQERRADLARLLTPGELAEYERRSSQTAMALRNQLRHFAPSETEYLAMYEVQRAFDDRYGLNHLSGEQADRRRDARRELFSAMEAALGAGRFEEYRLTTDGNYGATLSVVEAAGLPKDRARDLVRIQQDYNERAARLRAEAALAGEQTHAALEALATAARQDVGGIVGDRHMNQYLGRAGTWLRQLSPTPAPANR
jgi:hypothetical protein